MTQTIGIFTFDGAEELDVVGPYEVLAAWSVLHPDEATVFTLARDADRLITCAKGLRIQPDHDWRTAPAIDTLIYPGGEGTRRDLNDDAILSWVKAKASDGVLMTSVCTGSLVYAASGLLDGRPATTHWSALELLGSLGNDIEVRPDDRFIDDGDVITSAGVSAGIDMALHLIGRLHSVERAREVQKEIQYYPQPPV